MPSIMSIAVWRYHIFGLYGLIILFVLVAAISAGVYGIQYYIQKAISSHTTTGFSSQTILFWAAAGLIASVCVLTAYVIYRVYDKFQQIVSLLINLVRHTYRLEQFNGVKWVPLHPPWMTPALTLKRTTIANSQSTERVPTATQSDSIVEVSESATAEWEIEITHDEAMRERIRVVALFTTRMGNQLFQYCLARIRAMLLDVAFVSPPLEAPFNICAASTVLRWGNANTIGLDTTNDNNQLSARHEWLLRARTPVSMEKRLPLSVQTLEESSQETHLLTAAVGDVSSPARNSDNNHTSRRRRGSAVSLPRNDTNKSDKNEKKGIENQNKSTSSPHPRRGTDTDILVSSAWREMAHRWLVSPEGHYELNTRKFAGFEPIIAAWLRPGLEHALDIANGQTNTAQSTFTESRMKNRIVWNEDDIALHIRVGDALAGHHAAYSPLPLSYYRSALIEIAQKRAKLRDGVGYLSATLNGCSYATNNRVKDELTVDTPVYADADWIAAGGAKIVVISENSSHPLVLRTVEHIAKLHLPLVQPQSQRVRGQNGKIHDENQYIRPYRIYLPTNAKSRTVEDDYVALYTAPAIILSVSSFSWWPAWLSKSAKAIAMPHWGLFHRQCWRPGPILEPKVTIVHDATMRYIGDVVQGEGRDAAERERKSSSNGDGMSRRKREPSSLRISSLNDLLVYIEEAISVALPREHAVDPSILETTLPKFLPRDEIIEIELPNLKIWPGETKYALNTLFDIDDYGNSKGVNQ